MRNYIIQRVIWIFIILFSTLTITFVFLKSAPEYPPAKTEDKDVWLEIQVANGYYTKEIYTEDEVDVVEQIKIDNIDKINKTIFVVNPVDDSTIFKVFYRVPILKQYQKWLGNIFPHMEDVLCTITDTYNEDHVCFGEEAGTKYDEEFVWSDWGTSTRIRANTPAFTVIAERMPLTLSLNVFILMFYIPFGFFFGILAALKKDTFIDNIMQVFIMFFLSLPSLVFTLLLIIIFSYQMDNFLPSLFPLLARQSGWELAQGYIIPIVAGGLPAIAGFTRMLRAELSEVLTSEFVLLAKTKGLSHSQAVMRHAIRNSLVPMIPIIIGSFAGLLSGSFVLEKVYAFPGVGTITLRALTKSAYDYDVLMVSSAFYGIISLVTVLIVDLSYGIIDPQIRMGARK